MEASTTGAALICNKFLLLLCNISMTHWLHSLIFLVVSCQSVFIRYFMRSDPRVVTFL